MARFLPPDEPVELYAVGFEDDLLGREKVSKSLSEVLERIEDPLVVALDGRWGTGKTYFLKRWVGAHRLQNDGRALTVYFDAFAHDYMSDPLIALIGALEERLPRDELSKLDQVKDAAIKLMRPAVRISLAVASYGATEAFNGLGDAAAKAAEGEAKEALEAFWAREGGRQTAMERFRASIMALTESDGQEKPTPLIVVVDELDRCRPDYALEVLEVIKHFFAVPHVHFVLGVNLEALENSVKVRYGANIDASAYLQKFLSFSINLPEHVGDHDRTSSIITYANHLGATMETPNRLLNEIRGQLEIIERSNHISIRDVGKIMSMVALLPGEARSEDLLPGYRMAAVTLTIAKVIRPDLFEKFRSASIEDESLVKFLSVSSNLISEYLDNGDRNESYDHSLYLL